MKISNYITTLIEEKGFSTQDEINIEGHFGLTWEMLIDFVSAPEMAQYHNQIRTTLVKIDFHNGDIFHYLRHLAVGMLKSLGYEAE